MQVHKRGSAKIAAPGVLLLASWKANQEAIAFYEKHRRYPRPTLNRDAPPRPTRAARYVFVTPFPS